MSAIVSVNWEIDSIKTSSIDSYCSSDLVITCWYESANLNCISIKPVNAERVGRPLGELVGEGVGSREGIAVGILEGENVGDAVFSRKLSIVVAVFEQTS